MPAASRQAGMEKPQGRCAHMKALPVGAPSHSPLPHALIPPLTPPFAHAGTGGGLGHEGLRVLRWAGPSHRRLPQAAQRHKGRGAEQQGPLRERRVWRRDVRARSVCAMLALLGSSHAPCSSAVWQHAAVVHMHRGKRCVVHRLASRGVVGVDPVSTRELGVGVLTAGKQRL